MADNSSTGIAHRVAALEKKHEELRVLLSCANGYLTTQLPPIQKMGYVYHESNKNSPHDHVHIANALWEAEKKLQELSSFVRQW